MLIKPMEMGGHKKLLDVPKDVFGHEFHPQFPHSVLKCALDDFMGGMGSPQPKYLKIDVDGSENGVLDGSKDCLKKVNSVFIELTEEFMNSFAVLFLKVVGLV